MVKGGPAVMVPEYGKSVELGFDEIIRFCVFLNYSLKLSRCFTWVFDLMYDSKVS